MNQDFEVYKFSISSLEAIMNSIVLCQKKCLESINNSNSNEYNILINNKKIIDDIQKKIIDLRNNLENIITENLEQNDNSIDIESATKNLNEVINAECNKMYKFVQDTQEFISTPSYNSNGDLSLEFEKVYTMTEEVENMLKGIVFNNSSNNMVSAVIKDKIEEEQDKILNIRRETKVLNEKKNSELNDDLLFNYCDFIKIYIDKSNKEIENLNNIVVNNQSIFTKSEEVSVSLLKNIIEQEVEILVSSLDIIKKIVGYQDTSIVDEPSSSIGEASERIESYFNKINDIVNDFNNKDISNEEVVNRLLDLYKEEHQDTEEARKKLEAEYFNSSIDNKQKEVDTIEYKKYCSIINKSFWEARQRASLENIKYPSALYEKMVKEYQNEYLIQNYNISLEGAESFVEEYKNKYAGDIYMDSIYEQAILSLKNKTTMSIQEMCDENSGLSLLDKKAYEILQDDLTDVIKEIGIVKIEENVGDSVALSEYKKSAKLNELINRKEMIERQIYIISTRAQKLESRNS